MRIISHARKTPLSVTDASCSAPWETTKSVNFTLSVASVSVFCKIILFSKGEYENDSTRKAGNHRTVRNS